MQLAHHMDKLVKALLSSVILNQLVQEVGEGIFPFTPNLGHYFWLSMTELGQPPVSPIPNSCPVPEGVIRYALRI